MGTRGFGDPFEAAKHSSQVQTELHRQVTFSAVLDRELVLLRVTDLLAARGSIAAE